MGSNVAALCLLVKISTMKSISYAVLPLLMTIVGLLPVAASADQASLTQKMLKPVIEYQCTQELKTSKAWKAATIFMSAAQQKDNQKSICQCVSEHAMDDMNAKDLLVAAVDEAEKSKLVKKAVFNSIRGCAQQALN